MTSRIARLAISARLVISARLAIGARLVISARLALCSTGTFNDATSRSQSLIPFLLS
jgi:hypothetical protein